jgi:flagellar protein FliO/FliZ
MIIFIASQTGGPVFAEQSTTVKECIEHPKQCQEPTAPGGEGTKNSVVQGQDPFSVWDFFKMILATIFVVALMYALLRFMNLRYRSFSGKRGFIENLGGTSVGTNRSVQLIKVGNRILVIGVGESIQLLKEIDEDEEIKEILSEYNERLGQMIEPNKWLHNFLSSVFKKKEEPVINEPFRNLLTKQLQDIANQRNKLLRDLEQKGTKSDE